MCTQLAVLSKSEADDLFSKDTLAGLCEIHSDLAEVK